MDYTGQIIFIIFIVCYIIFWGTIIYIGIPKENRVQHHIADKIRDQRDIGEP